MKFNAMELRTETMSIKDSFKRWSGQIRKTCNQMLALWGLDDAVSRLGKLDERPGDETGFECRPSKKATTKEFYDPEQARPPVHVTVNVRNNGVVEPVVVREHNLSSTFLFLTWLECNIYTT